MTALLEFKQKIKGLFAQYEVYVMPLLKFILALVYFIWINSIDPGSDLQRSSNRNDHFCRMCDDGGTLLCAWNRSCGLYAGDPFVYADPVPEIQCRKEYRDGIYTSGICV